MINVNTFQSLLLHQSDYILSADTLKNTDRRQLKLQYCINLLLTFYKTLSLLRRRRMNVNKIFTPPQIM